MLVVNSPNSGHHPGLGSAFAYQRCPYKIFTDYRVYCYFTLKIISEKGISDVHELL